MKAHLLFLIASGLFLAEALPGDEEARWAFRPVRRPEVPAVRGGEWCRNPIDCFVLARLEREGLAPSPEADRAVLIRRMALDVLGLPPSPEEVEDFRSDPRPDAVERLADRLLASPRHGERWARHWLDVVRFAETNGFETNTPRENAWPYRDYLIRAFNEDRPYTDFILEQLAGDAVGEDAATGFLVGGASDTVKSPDQKLTLEQRAGELQDMVSTAGGAFLGLTAGCARCHDHKFDPISQRDYYALAAVFAGVQHGERELAWPDAAERAEKAARVQAEIAVVEARLCQLEPLADSSRRAGEQGPLRPPVNARRNCDRFPAVRAKLIRFTVLATNQLEPCLDELEVHTAGPQPRNVALAGAGARPRASSEYPDAAIHRIVHLNDGQYGNGRSWISREPGKGWAEIELAGCETVDRVIWGRDREGRYRDRLPVEYRIEVAEEPGRYQVVASSADRRPFGSPAGPEEVAAGSGGAEADERAARRLPPPSPPRERLRARLGELEGRLVALTRKRTIYAGAFSEPPPTRLLFRGDPLEAREEVGPEAVAYLARPLGLTGAAPERERRLALARWIGDARNPLTPRVMVNRIWHYHFGRGLVATPSDFGAMGARPTHPELLDWLASEFVASGWRPKAIHRLILLSQSYRQSSRSNPPGLAADAGTALYWRFPPRRLEAEAIRDSILRASGTLDLTMGGPGYQVFEPNQNYVRVYQPKEKFGPAEWRRMVYQTKPRKEQDSTFGAFDCPDGSQAAPKRLVSTNALQALNLLNSGFMVEQARFLAERLRRESTEDPPACARRAFRLVLCRDPDPTELEASVRLIAGNGLAVFCRALFNAGEFVELD